MFKVLLIFAAAVAASHGNPSPSNPLHTFASLYTLYANNHPNVGQPIQLNVDSVRALNITATTNCAIIVHGVNDRGIGAMSTVVRDALLTSGIMNVIVVDWSSGATNEWAIDSIEQVTKDAVDLIRLLETNSKISSAKLHLIGFDMGTHIVGHIGRTPGLTIARITGLNPTPFSGQSLRRTDATYVEVIHTETTSLGDRSAMGHVDFYPQGGIDQPGCADVMCSHNRAWELFAASLTHDRIIGNRCANLAEAMSDKPCTGFTLALGTNDLVKYGSGLYRLETNPVYPYRCLVKCGLIDSIIDAIEKLTMYKTLN